MAVQQKPLLQSSASAVLVTNYAILPGALLQTSVTPLVSVRSLSLPVWHQMIAAFPEAIGLRQPYNAPFQLGIRGGHRQ